MIKTVAVGTDGSDIAGRSTTGTEASSAISATVDGRGRTSGVAGRLSRR
jgi:hypothetical protein